jgi:gas vesicle protein
MSEEKEEKQTSGFSWFLAGLGIGALVGVLYAPKAGRETREDLASGAREGKEYLRQRSQEAASQVSQIVDRSKVQVSEYVDRGREYVDRGKAQWDDFINQSRKVVTEQKEKVVAAVDAGREAYRHSTAEPGEAPSEHPVA